MGERYQKLRRQFVVCMLFLVVGIAVVEILFYFLIHRQEMSWTTYSEMYFWLPLLFNGGGWIALYVVLDSPNISDGWKNFATVFYLGFLCTTVSAVHFRQVPAVVGCYHSPVIWSAIYGDKKLSRFTHALSQLVLAILCAFYSWLNGGMGSNEIGIVAIMFTLVISRLLAAMLMRFVREKDEMIQLHEQDNESLGKRLLREPMTGLYNHSAFYSLLEKKIRERGDAPLSLAIVDIDNFKAVNDTYGHENGDKVILYLAELLKRHCGERYLPCRYGGEEFAVIFPGLKGKEARVVMEEILAEFRAKEFEWNSGPGITFSCGVFQHNEVNMTATELFQIADQMLYKAKQGGKNCCVSGL